MWIRIQEWWAENKERFWLFLGVFLVGMLCFEAGFLQGRTGEKTPVVLTMPSPLEKESPLNQGGVTPATSLTHAEPVGATVPVKASCLFVGSKNSNKYHLSTCAVAKRIKAENRICFASKEDAERRGYVPSCLK